MVGGLVLGAIGLLLFAQLGVHSGFWSQVLPAEVVTSLGLRAGLRAADLGHPGRGAALRCRVASAWSTPPSR